MPIFGEKSPQLCLLVETRPVTSNLENNTICYCHKIPTNDPNARHHVQFDRSENTNQFMHRHALVGSFIAKRRATNVILKWTLSIGACKRNAGRAETGSRSFALEGFENLVEERFRQRNHMIPLIEESVSLERRYALIETLKRKY